MVDISCKVVIYKLHWLHWYFTVNFYELCTLTPLAFLPSWAIHSTLSAYQLFRHLTQMLRILGYMAVVDKVSSCTAPHVLCPMSGKPFWAFFPGIWFTTAFLCPYGIGIQAISADNMPNITELYHHIFQSHFTIADLFLVFPLE